MMEQRQANPLCPRCGYDQSGEVCAWAVRCPVEGRCPECGTKFGWADLFDPSRQAIPWLVEHAPTVRAMAVRTAPTLARALAPWIFWRRVGVQTGLRPGRIALWLLWWTVGAHLLTAPFVGVFLAGSSRVGETGWRGLWLLREVTTRNQVVADTVNGVTWPFYIMPASGVRPADGDAASAMPYLAPAWIGLSWMFLLAILPTTRRLARLRFAHLWRALCLHAAVVVLAVEAVRVLTAAYEHFWDDRLIGAGIALTGAVMVWSVLWWACAIRVGWRIRSWLLLFLGFAVAFLSMPFVIGLGMTLINAVEGT